MITFRYTSPDWPSMTVSPPSRWRQEARRFGVKVADRVAASLFLLAGLELAHAAGWRP